MLGNDQPESQFVRIPIDQIKPGPNVRTDFEADEIDSLGNNILENGQLLPVLVVQVAPGTFELVDGNRRFLAAKRKKVEFLVGVVLKRKPEGAELAVIQLSTAIHAKNLSPFELFAAIHSKLVSDPTLTQKKIAELLGLKEATLSKILAPSKCVGEAVEAFRLGQIGPTEIYELSKAPLEMQFELLQKLLTGTTRDEIAREIRQRRQPEKGTSVTRKGMVIELQAAKVRLDCQLQDIDGAIRLLNDAIRELKLGKSNNMSLTTLERHLGEKWNNGSPEVN